MNTPFTPPYPEPHRSKLASIPRFISGWGSWIHTLYAKSYRMKMGEIRLPGVDFYIPNDLPLVEEVLEHPERYPKHAMLHEVLEPLIGDSVFSINGEAWKDTRAMVNPAFAHTHLRRAFPTMDAAATDLLSLIQKQDLGKPVHIDPLMTHVTADVIFRTIMSQKLTEDEARHVYEAFERYQRWVQPCMIFKSYGLPYGFFKRRLLAAAAEIHKVLAPLVNERHRAFHAGEEGPADILQALMQAKHPKTGAPFTGKELLDQVAIIFLAGHETTASALTWALYLIASCPHLQEALRAEANVEPFDADAIRKMEQIRDTFRETMRLYPPVSFLMRAVNEPTTMRGKHIEPGDLMVVSPWLVQRNEENFPCPHAFMPERFRDETQADACRRAYLPFGAGPRICIGAGFAQQEAVVILARILQHFTLNVPKGHRPEPVSRLTLRPRRGVHLHITPRSPTAA